MLPRVAAFCQHVFFIFFLLTSQGRAWEHLPPARVTYTSAHVRAVLSPPRVMLLIAFLVRVLSGR
jgi:hypothetical protein